MKKILLFIFFTQLPFLSRAQGNSDFSIPRTPSDNTLLPSPEATAMMRYSDYPVSHSTGLADISVPLYDVARGELSLSLSASYHGGGVKVNELSGTLGLGWSLHAGGSISRTIMGQPDERLPFEIKTANEISRQNDLQYLKDLHQLRKEANYDRYSYNFCGYSGSFLCTPESKTIIPLSASDNRIEVIDQAGGSQFSFRIITPDGNMYYFTEKETSEYRYNPSVMSNTYRNPAYSAITTWHLGKVVSFNGRDSITLAYTDMPAWSRITYERYASLSGTYISNQYPYFTVSGGFPPPVDASSTTRYYDSKVLSRIQFGQGKIVFTAVHDITASNHPKTRLSKFEVTDHSGKLIRRVEFGNNRRFGDGRPCLGGISIFGDNELIDKYTFDYHDQSTRIGEARDFFGYYNGRNALCASDLSILDSEGHAQDNRKYDFEFARTYALQKITNLTGASTEFVYEPNTHIEQLILGNTNVPVSIGLRIKEIQAYDPVSGQAHKRAYTYENSLCGINFGVSGRPVGRSRD